MIVPHNQSDRPRFKSWLQCIQNKICVDYNLTNFYIDLDGDIPNPIQAVIRSFWLPVKWLHYHKKLICYSQNNGLILLKQKHSRGVYSHDQFRQFCLYFKDSEGVFCEAKWPRHDIGMLSTWLSLCVGNPPISDVISPTNYQYCGALMFILI